MTKNVYSVKQVNAYIKNMFVQDFMLNRIYVKGEVSNCKYHTSGHIYFSLKDESGAIACVMFAGDRRKGLAFRMQEGQKVIVLGSVSVYERDGRYQLYAKEIVPDGEGDLYRQFEKLKKELEEMGMFAPEFKQPIPFYSRKVGIVTAPTGAAGQAYPARLCSARERAAKRMPPPADGRGVRASRRRGPPSPAAPASGRGASCLYASCAFFLGLNRKNSQTAMPATTITSIRTSRMIHQANGSSRVLTPTLALKMVSSESLSKVL